MPFERLGRVALPGVGALDVWWLASYGGGVWLPMRDADPRTYRPFADMQDRAGWHGPTSPIVSIESAKDARGVVRDPTDRERVTVIITTQSRSRYTAIMRMAVANHVGKSLARLGKRPPMGPVSAADPGGYGPTLLHRMEAQVKTAQEQLRGGGRP